MAPKWKGREQEYQKEYMRDYRKHKTFFDKLNVIDQEFYLKFLALIRQGSEYLKASPEDRIAMENSFAEGYWKQAADSHKQILELFEEIEQYAKLSMWELIEEAKKKRRQMLDAELRRMLEPILSLPYEQRVKAYERIVEELFGVQKHDVKVEPKTEVKKA